MSSDIGARLSLACKTIVNAYAKGMVQRNVRRGFGGWLSSGLAVTAMGVAAWWLGRLSKDEELRSTLMNRGRAYGDQLWRTATAMAEKLRPETAKDRIIEVEQDLQPGG